MSSMEGLSFDSENEVYVTGDEGRVKEIDSNVENHNLEHMGSDGNNIRAHERDQEARLSIDVPSGHSDTSYQPRSAWSSSSSEEEREGEEIPNGTLNGQEDELDETTIHNHPQSTQENRLNVSTSDAGTCDISLVQAWTDNPLVSIVGVVAIERSLNGDATGLVPFLDFDGVWVDEGQEESQRGPADGDKDAGTASNEVSLHLRLQPETADDQDADDESSAISSLSTWQAQEHLALEHYPHLRGRRLSITDQYNVKEWQRSRGNIETAIKRAIQRQDPAKQRIASLDAYDRPHEGLERMGDPRVKAHLRPGEHANTPRKPSPLRRYEDRDAVANETDVSEPRSPDCVLLPKITYEEKIGWSLDETRQYLKKKWHPDAKNKIMSDDVNITSSRLVELLEAEPNYSAMLDHNSLTVLLRACREASASNDPDIRRAFLLSDTDARMESATPAETSSLSVNPTLSRRFPNVLAEEGSIPHIVSPLDSEANGQGLSPLQISVKKLQNADEMTTHEALAATEEYGRHSDNHPPARREIGIEPNNAAERLAKKRTQAEFEWDYEEYELRRQGYEQSPRLKLPENQKVRAEYARAMAHLYRYERDEAQRKAAFLRDGARDAERLRREGDKLLGDVSDYKKALGQNFAEIVRLEERLRQKCQHCGKSREDLEVNHIEIAAASNTPRCLESTHAELERELSTARERIRALHEENEELEASLEKRKAKIAELKAFTLSWKQRAEAAQAQAEQVQGLADCELLRRVKESGTTDRGTDPDGSPQRAYEERIVFKSRQQLQTQYDELTERFDDCKKQLEQSRRNHHDDLKKSGDEQRELRFAVAQFERQRAALEIQLQQSHHRQGERHLSPPNAPGKATLASSQRPFTPPDSDSSQNSGSPTTSARTPRTPGLAAFLSDLPPATPAMERSESWHKRNARVLESSVYKEVKKKLQAHRDEQRKTELREKKLREKAYLDLFGIEFQPLSVSEKKTTYYKLAHKFQPATKQTDIGQSRSQERIRQKSGVETTYREYSEARLSASRDHYNARSPTKPYHWTAPDEEDFQANLERRLWGSGGESKYRYA
ncbi:hypothetical protein DOTSEDRAFT_27646 [Dothistroma septosporum NZE10]|uniref:J domain-containing protein n=1 Tax=Dothistroma septosporum (strain NZE10 / CBS 128990) TaxID=675120 RepID=N1PFA8_DOTSN|nr:hypothetical protein DOTSEDRAFT_27646 [Dothistroma septosporum NZE10]